MTDFHWWESWVHANSGGTRWLCLLCIEEVLMEDLHVDADGNRWNVCKTCQADEEARSGDNQLGPEGQPPARVRSNQGEIREDPVRGELPAPGTVGALPHRPGQTGPLADMEGGTR